jgi:predicted transcriptional regulator
MGRRQYSEWTSPERSVFRLIQSSNKNRLGPLEQRILSVLWQRGSATVHEVIKCGEIRREYSTVMTTLDRLYRKQLADRTTEPHSRAFRYVPRHPNQAAWERAMMINIVKQILGVDTAFPALSYLVEAISEHDAALLNELRRLVDEKLQSLTVTGADQRT